MTEEILQRRNETLVRRQRLAPGESTSWHRDPYHRVTVVLDGDALAIEYRDGSPAERVSVRPGQVDWDQPTERIHRGVNVGREPYEEITVFFLDDPDADPQPRVTEDEDSARERSGAVRQPAAPTALDSVPNSLAAQDVLAASSVVRDEAGRVLLIKTAEAGWELPGGRVEHGEDFVSALVREVREETGCEIEVGRLTGVTSRTGVPRLTIFTFLCRHIVGDPSPRDDSIDAGWFAADTAVALVTHPVEQLRLSDALAEGPGVAYRAYRRVPDQNAEGDAYEMLLLHRC
jgi:ADP-ribose pyrophosphatase YjhB (NUDIX family)/quercetin dioxygenase-like cupin family protein